MTTKGRKFHPEVMTADEMRRMLVKCDDTVAGRRDCVLLIVLWRCGLRVSEALDLEVKDVDFDRGTIRVMHGKGNKARTVGMDAAASFALGVWVKERASLRIPAWAGPRPLFHTLNGKYGRIHSEHVRRTLRHLAARAGIEKRVHPHGLRHTMAVELRDEGNRISDISQQLGHSSVVTTATYLNHIAPDAAIRMMKGRVSA